MTQVRAGPGLVPRLRRSDHFPIDTQPSRAGLMFGGRPSGPRINGDFGVSFLSQLAVGKLAAPDGKKKARRVP
jgi:hypothetical protein